MKAINVFVVLIAAIILSACSGNNPAPVPATGPTISNPPVEEPAGKNLFEAKCAACHGNSGAAGIADAANLKTSKMDSAVIITTVAEGKGAMPSFKNQLSNEEINKLADYVLELRNKRN